MQVVLDEAINKEKERIDKLIDMEIENKIKPTGEILQDKINRLSEENFKQSQYIDQLESCKQNLIENLEELKDELEKDGYTCYVEEVKNIINLQSN